MAITRNVKPLAGRYLWLTAACVWMCVADMGSAQSASDVRIGVVVYEAAPGESSSDPAWQELLTKWEVRSGLRIRYAKGTHSDVLHWMHNRVVDAVVLPAGALVQEEKAEREADRTQDSGMSWSIPSPHFDYLATFGYPAATTELAEPDRRQPGSHWFSRSVCVVSKDSDIDSEGELLEAARSGRLHVLMVHPYSASGSLLPRAHLLERLGVELHPDQIEYTFSHTESLERVAEGSPGLAAFVWDGALDVVPELAGALRRIDLPGLTAKTIPNEALLVRSGSPHESALRSLAAAEIGTERLALRTFEDWSSRYGKLAAWTRGVRVPTVGFEARKLSLDEVGWLLLYSARSQQQPPRLAVVLAGGGAKCSYQVGVLEALEEKLADLRRTIPHLTEAQRASLDIQLVVGTSGGAINALPVALGVSSTAEGRRAFKRAWMDSDQREILQPPAVQRVVMGLWFGLAQIVVLAWLLRTLVRDESRRHMLLATSLVILGAIELVLRELSWSPWAVLGTNHLWHHLYLLFTFAFRVSAVGLLVAGAIGLAAWRLSPGTWRVPEGALRVFWRLLVVLLVILPVVSLWYLFFHQRTMLAGSGVERQILSVYSELIEVPQARSMIDPRESLHRLSVAAESSLIRDLVITGTMLPRAGESTEDDLPDDLYFFARAGGVDSTAEEPPFGARGVSLNDPRYRHMLLDVLMGSSSIFPVFPARVLSDFPVEGQSVELVDGGFAHNSPIEAAVMWGASHVILIEVSPETRSSRKNFIANVAAALGHLQQQTEQVDRRSKQHVRVFTLEPRPPHLCILCFADNLIERAICNGYFDATGKRHPECQDREALTDDRTVAGHWFEEDLGPPDFVEVDPQAR